MGTQAALGTVRDDVKTKEIKYRKSLLHVKTKLPKHICL